MDFEAIALIITPYFLNILICISAWAYVHARWDDIQDASDETLQRMRQVFLFFFYGLLMAWAWQQFALKAYGLQPFNLGETIFLYFFQSILVSYPFRLWEKEAKKGHSPTWGLAIIFMAYFGFLGFFIGGIVGLHRISVHYQLGSFQSFAVLVSGLFVILGIGMTIVFLTAPYGLRCLFPCAPIEDEELLSEVSRPFKEAGKNVPELLVFPSTPPTGPLAMASGLSWGRGRFRPCIFFSQILLDEFSKKEQIAILHHEIGHLYDNHLIKRFVYSLVGIVATTMIAGILLFIIATFQFSFNINLNMKGVTIFLALMTVLVQFLYLRWIVRKQEILADAYTLLKGNVAYDDFKDSLVKVAQYTYTDLDQSDPVGMLMPSAALPSINERLKMLKDHHDYKELQIEKQLIGSSLFNVQVIAPVIVLLVGFVWAIAQAPIKVERKPASGETPAIIKNATIEALPSVKDKH